MRSIMRQSDTGHLRRASTQGFDAHGAGPRVQIKEPALGNPIAENGKQRFPDPVGGRTECGPLRSPEAPASVGSSDHTHVLS